MSIYNYSAKTISGEEVSLEKYKGKVLLIVNTASKCGFTPQFDGLQKVYEKYQENGLEILGFPSNQFMQQEPGEGDEIEQFCKVNYGVTFQMFDKIDVNGDGAHPLYNYLKSEAPGFLGTKGIKWNFTKFLISKEGKVLKRYSPKTKPEDIVKDITTALS